MNRLHLTLAALAVSAFCLVAQTGAINASEAGTSPDLALPSSSPVTADVVSTSNLRSFSAYGIEACYRFHGYKLRDVASISGRRSRR